MGSSSKEPAALGCIRLARGSRREELVGSLSRVSRRRLSHVRLVPSRIQTSHLDAVNSSPVGVHFENLKPSLSTLRYTRVHSMHFPTSLVSELR
jgi:hypothetical protein